MATEHRTDLIPPPPMQTMVYPLLIAAGFAIVVSALGIAVVLAAESGSELLGDFQDEKTFGAWLQTFAFTGLALVLSGIVLALYTISQALRFQHGRIAQMARGAE